MNDEILADYSTDDGLSIYGEDLELNMQRRNISDQTNNNYKPDEPNNLFWPGEASIYEEDKNNIYEEEKHAIYEESKEISSNNDIFGMRALRHDYDFNTFGNRAQSYTSRHHLEYDYGMNHNLLSKGIKPNFEEDRFIPQIDRFSSKENELSIGFGHTSNEFSFLERMTKEKQKNDYFDLQLSRNRTYSHVNDVKNGWIFITSDEALASLKCNQMIDQSPKSLIKKTVDSEFFDCNDPYLNSDEAVSCQMWIDQDSIISSKNYKF